MPLNNQDFLMYIKKGFVHTMDVILTAVVHSHLLHHIVLYSNQCI